MATAPVLFQVVRAWKEDEIIALYQSAGWWRNYYDPTGIAPLIRGSFIFAVGIDSRTGKAVAMGRVISDQIFTGYIHDLCVLTEKRGLGIGMGILDFIIQQAKCAGLSSLFLVAEPGTTAFYKKSGFISNKGKIFLTYNPDGQYET
ncbi:MAG TPA: GNAT family N-acetyltransferase [Methanospirillum sp.]|uniref:GNAT family N-acetyltransferase n=1 Tax=Methanospirillum sp. TaxID=45200 RepID=UPI002C748DFE|nr:GNAT family N-acetyltransferase [Methanospirillum sp.]HWQ63294.1 GNAT family N-acetyltransferase [Methanospirillum sp.]